MPPRISLPLLAVGAAAVLAGCGSTASGSTGGYGAPAAASSAAVVSGHVQTLKLTADPGGALRFNTTHLTAKAGKVKIVLTNPKSAGMAHGIAIQGHGSSPVVAAGKTTSVTATLKKGKYTFLCPVPGHAAAGMKGTLTVK
ncbi:plastocyanin/azurin family copper-binding protein [Solirubrobacter soli]|uniref:plastocyanin/azurin family copper-binding protein n=1 Tax=Solirubrobacter soli TaxID=363832 RepID=UPI0003F7C881|nr:plastocyanin/azurin family copper-binding protein [Solirubrobacter soli]